MRKIIIIGSGGAGKSFLARHLGECLALPVIHLDAAFWRPGWTETPRPEWRERVAEMLRGDTWIMDGNFGGTLEMRLAACDTVIFLDLPRALCLWRVIKRRIRYHRASRPDMTAGCQEKLDAEFLAWIWRYPRNAVWATIQQHAAGKQVFRLTSRAGVATFIESLTPNLMKSQ